MSSLNKFSEQMKAWNDLKPYDGVNLSNREILHDTVLSMCTLLTVMRPYLLFKAPPIEAGVLDECVGTLQTNIRWLKTILERSPKQKPVAHGLPKVKQEDVLPY